MIRKRAFASLTTALHQGSYQVGTISPAVSAMQISSPAKSTKATSLQLQSTKTQKFQSRHCDVYLYFFLDDTCNVLSTEEAKSSVLPFLKRVKEIRYGTGKRLSAAYALAALELEIQRSAASAYKFLSMDHLEKFGGLGKLLEGSN